MNTQRLTRRPRTVRALAALTALLLVVSACGGSDDDSGPTGEPLSLPNLEAVIRAEHPNNVWPWIVFEDGGYREAAGFESLNTTYTDEAVSALRSGEAWFAQMDPEVAWPANEQGVGDFVAVAVVRDGAAWYMGVSADIETPDDLRGARVSAGPPGDPWTIVARIILEEEFGIGADEVEWVAVGGGANTRMEALAAGQIDAAMLQIRHVGPVEELGGHMIYADIVEFPEQLYFVTRDTLESHGDAVCALVDQLVEMHQWASADGGQANRDANVEMQQARGIDVAQNWIDDYERFMTTTYATDAGVSVMALERSLETAEVSDAFDWRDHVDFSCLWEAQERRGLPLNPNPDEI